MAEAPDTVAEAMAALPDSPTDEQVLQATRGFSAREIADYASQQAASGGSLPSQWNVDGSGGLTISPTGTVGTVKVTDKACLVVETGPDADRDTLLVRGDPTQITDLLTVATFTEADSESDIFEVFPNSAIEITARSIDGGVAIFDDANSTGAWLLLLQANAARAGSYMVVRDENFTKVFEINATGGVSMPNLPTSDPAVAGELWVDPSASFVVKQSQG